MRCCLSRVLAVACAVSFGTGWSTGAHAAASHPAEIPQGGKPGKDYICEQFGNKHLVTRRALLDWVADHFSLRRRCAPTQDDTLSVLVDPDSARDCTKGDKSSALQARYLIASVLRDENPAHFKVHGWGDENPQTRGPARLIGELDSFLRGPNSPRVIECLKAKEERPKADSGFDVSDLKVGTWMVKLRGDQYSLEADKNNKDAFKKAKSAQFSITDDLLSDQTKFDVKATVGIDSDWKECGRDQECRMIPYVKWEHARTSPKQAKNDTDKTTYGVLGVHRFALREWPISWKTTLDLQYIVDEKGPEPTEIVAGTVKWRPAFTVAPGVIVPGPARPIGNMILFGYDFGGVLRYGEALESGGSIIFDQQKTFLYAGGDIDVWFMGVKDTALERVKLQLYYSHLFAQRGIFSQLPYFSAELSYQLDKDGLFDIKITYDHGREYETFEEREVWKTSLGFKF